MSLDSEIWQFPDKRLEILRQGPRHARSPVVFVHGVCHGAWCWAHFTNFFADRGHDAVAMSLRGHGGSSGRQELNRFGLDDYVEDVRDVISRLDRPPVLVGHSMGGAIVQRYLARHAGTVSGVVLLASATVGGLGGRTTLDVLRGNRPMSMLNALRTVFGGHVEPKRANNTPFFGNRLNDEDARGYGSRLGPESRRAVRDLLMRFEEIPERRPPMMVIGSRADTLFGVDSQLATARAYGVTALLVDEMCHDMMLDPQWRTPARQVGEFIDTLASPSTAVPK